MSAITGLEVYYFIVCKRKLWYYAHNLNMEHNSELVEIGGLINDESYNREKKDILIDENIKVDFIKDWKVVHEVKKSRKIEEASIIQLKYYMYVLKNKGMDIEKGVLDYPLIKKRKEVYLDEEDCIILEETLREIEKVKDLKIPPEPINSPICKSCAYYELCYI
ncbi:MAG: CRISPR-associated protein Cas4 [Tissierellales bacterium]|nr:CRISPR-associated protein Cas4 [Tissierellales bacterium]